MVEKVKEAVYAILECDKYKYDLEQLKSKLDESDKENDTWREKYKEALERKEATIKEMYIAIDQVDKLESKLEVKEKPDFEELLHDFHLLLRLVKCSIAWLYSHNRNVTLKYQRLKVN